MGGSLAAVNLPATVSGNTFNADNEMTSFNGTTLSYDANGNLTADGTNSYTWDARNHLTGISGGASASVVYDAFGRRVSKTINGATTQFLYDGWNPVQELNGSNPPTPTANLLTGLGIDEYFTRTDSSGTMSFLTGALGSTIALANSSGAIATQYTYEPFGNTTVSGPPNANPYQFTGRENDGTGLYYFRARYYSPTFQRFIAQDPIGFAGGDLNLYGYVLNDPRDSRDLLGLFNWGLPINIVLGGGTCGFTGGIIGGALGTLVTDNPFGAAAGAAFLNTIAQRICNDPCAGSLNCNEDRMLQADPPPLVDVSPLSKFPWQPFGPPEVCSE